MENTNTPIVNFVLKFEAHKMSVIFNPAPDATVKTIGGNGTSWKGAKMCNAIGERINVLGRKYQYIEDGLWLQKSWTELREELENENTGYALSDKARKLIEAGKCSYRNEVLDDKVYRVAFDGMGFHFKLMNVKEFSENEHPEVGHVREAYILIKNLYELDKAARKGWNLQFIYTEKEVGRFTLMQEQWELFINEEFEALAENIHKHVEDGSYKKAVRQATAWTNNPENPKSVDPGFAGTELSGVVVDMRDYIGKTIHLWAPEKGGTFHELKHNHKVEIQSAAGYSKTLRDKGARFTVVEIAEVVDMAIESVEKKATRKGKKVAAA